MTFHTNWPWHTVQRAYSRFRSRFFTVDRPPEKYFRVDATKNEIEYEFGIRSWAPNWEFSYNKRGERINLARVVYEPRKINGEEYTWWQAHVRGWQMPNGRFDLGGHWETEPTEHPTAHLNGVGWDRNRGMENIKTVLDTSDLEYEEIIWDESQEV